MEDKDNVFEKLAKQYDSEERVELAQRSSLIEIGFNSTRRIKMPPCLYQAVLRDKVSKITILKERGVHFSLV
ncbi:hypothetical protein ACFFGV_15140 [Pontibacillus salicampi]|uniref:Uncharacterized protein n=1 Tax=Pontibacillus salicampi TaxID=1449801 RepID=A0ABV6LRI0_9BACI